MMDNAVRQALKLLDLVFELSAPVRHALTSPSGAADPATVDNAMTDVVRLTAEASELEASIPFSDPAPHAVFYSTLDMAWLQIRMMSVAAARLRAVQVLENQVMGDES